jgi:hypothetical protein
MLLISVLPGTRNFVGLSSKTENSIQQSCLPPLLLFEADSAAWVALGKGE